MSDFQTTNPVIKWIEYRLPVFSFLDHAVGSKYPTPKNLSYWWNFGSLAGLMLVIMIMTGIVLAMMTSMKTCQTRKPTTPGCCGRNGLS